MKWTDELDGEFNGNPCKIRVGVSETYSESAILKLTKMILSIFDDYNLNDFYINSDVCIEYADLLKLKDLARDILKCEKGDEYE